MAKNWEGEAYMALKNRWNDKESPKNEKPVDFSEILFDFMKIIEKHEKEDHYLPKSKYEAIQFGRNTFNLISHSENCKVTILNSMYRKFMKMHTFQRSVNLFYEKISKESTSYSERSIKDAIEKTRGHVVSYVFSLSPKNNENSIVDQIYKDLQFFHFLEKHLAGKKI